jgi:O-antigen/teichoic acid export membrane protein
MSVKKNAIANYLGTGVVALAPLLALPWYLARLGPSQFGLVGFIATLQAVLGLLDAGMSQALVREVALRFASSDQARYRTATLLLGFERLYWLFAVLVAGVTWRLADAIATHWIQLGALPIADGKLAVAGAAALFAVQFPGSIYRSVLVGTQAQAALSFLMAGAALVRHVGAVVALAFWPDLATYVVWHAVTALLETLLRRQLAWRQLGVKKARVSCDIQDLQPVLQTAARMSVAVLLGALTVQMDKIVLSRMVSLEQFGYYTVASSAALGLLLLISPLVQAVLPRAVQLRDQPLALRQLNFKLLGLIAGMVIAVAAVFICCGRWLLMLWLHDARAVEVIHPLLSVLLLGTAMNAFYNVGYIHWLVLERVGRILLVNGLSVVLALVLTPLLVLWKGSLGATLGWVLINLIGLMLSLEWLKRKSYEKSH